MMAAAIVIAGNFRPKHQQQVKGLDLTNGC
jgi:hypothetical protein